MPEQAANVLEVPEFIAVTIGIIVFLTGMQINKRFTFLRHYNIPEPVTGGLIGAAIALGTFLLFDLQISYELEARNALLVYFFTAIGLNARFSDLIAGGRPLAIMLVLTLGFIVVQDIVGVAAALGLGQPYAVGILAGSASLIGGHGTTIAWAPDIAADHGVVNALEIGVACATLGLVIASLIGGPIAQYLITRGDLKSTAMDETPTVGLPHAKAGEDQKINHINLMRVILALHLAIILGYAANEALVAAGFKLPLFVTCLLAGILLSNTVPHIFPGISWPARTNSLALVSDFSLGLFLAMSLMSMQLWTIAGLAGPLMIILAIQTVAAVAFILFVLFPLMGRDYQAAVLSAGFGGFAMGATPTAIANMTAVTKAHGPAPMAFIILPLVSAFFVDVTNAVVIKAFLDWFSGG
ncbi:MAG: sodium/glutamate symporter [Hyphomicrobiales bacterium]